MDQYLKKRSIKDPIASQKAAVSTVSAFLLIIMGIHWPFIASKIEDANCCSKKATSFGAQVFEIPSQIFDSNKAEDIIRVLLEFLSKPSVTLLRHTDFDILGSSRINLPSMQVNILDETG
mmetsp:Transcript_13535/g.27015  ORF Transcript_13535/g.27015 Transcript_13535/m.27015 type:complete len:120 (-) Transcript_13535:631-990(-)